MASDITTWMAEQSGGKGNVLIVRGVKGSAPELNTYNGQTAILKKYPDLKVVGETFGMAAAASAQAAVSNLLPSLPHVDVVLAAGGGDAYGIVQAFKQYGGDYVNHMPMIGGDNSGDFVSWWVAEKKANGYQTISINPPPGIGSAVLWLALDIEAGKNVPNSSLMPVMKITNDTLDQFSDLKPGEIASLNFDNAWVDANILKAQ
jgi:ribose transport system substrate-binding protein